MSILSDFRIKQLLDKGKIFIHPFNQDRLNNCSYDVALGENFYFETKTSQGIFNIWSKEQVEETWKLGETVTADYLSEKYPGVGFSNFPPDTKIILVHPGQTILAHTEEYIGGVTGVTGQMFCRSSYGRCGITVCKCAGWGDAGYVNRWTMEITNVNQYNTIPLIVGEPIAQIVFSEFNTIETFTYSDRGNYQKKSYLREGKIDVESLQKDWSPEDMLPKLYRKKTI